MQRGQETHAALAVSSLFTNTAACLKHAQPSPTINSPQPPATLARQKSRKRAVVGTGAKPLTTGTSSCAQVQGVWGNVANPPAASHYGSRSNQPQLRPPAPNGSQTASNCYSTHLLPPLLLGVGPEGQRAGVGVLRDGGAHVRRAQPLQPLRPIHEPAAAGIHHHRFLRIAKRARQGVGWRALWGEQGTT